MEETTSKNIYSKLKAVRRARGLTVDKLAEQIGENSQKIGRIERGKSHLTVDYLLKLSKALGISLDSILKEEITNESSSQVTNDLLNEIILQVEKKSSSLLLGISPEKKANFITFLFSQTVKIPKEHQKHFIESIFQCLEFFINKIES